MSTQTQQRLAAASITEQTRNVYACVAFQESSLQSEVLQLRSALEAERKGRGSTAAGSHQESQQFLQYKAATTKVCMQ
jgi:hypothetical protein